MSANTLDTTTYNDVAANTVDNAVLDPDALLAWRQNVKAVVDQHATEIDGKVSKSGGAMTGALAINKSEAALTLQKSVAGSIYINFKNESGTDMGYAGFSNGSSNFALQLINSLTGWPIDLITTGGAAVKLNGVAYYKGTGSPEGVVTGIIGDMFTRTDGGATTTLYVKTSGTGNTGWTAK